MMMQTLLWADLFFTRFKNEQGAEIVQLNAMPLMLGVLCVLAIAYRYYSAFLAAKVAALDDANETPAHRYNDGQNYHPTNKWVLFGHHFAAISGAGPLIGPVLAIQYGYMPGLLWLVIGVCLAGAVQDMLVLAASVRRDGKSLAEIARAELGRPAAVVVSAAILFIVIIALAGLGIVVVNALGGETVKVAEGTRILVNGGPEQFLSETQRDGDQESAFYRIPPGSKVLYGNQKPDDAVAWGEPFSLRMPMSPNGSVGMKLGDDGLYHLPTGTKLIVAGSSWGTFTIACTIPIALFVGLYMYKIRKGAVVEASLIGAAAVLAATVAGAWIPHSPLREVFSLSRNQTILALTTYGFIASVLPVWMLLCPRDYLSSFLKIGTIALLVLGLIFANPTLKSPALNEVFLSGGPTFRGSIFPFVFICIMCGAISGFHALVSSGTTPKMVSKETDVRTIGYGAMLMEGLVGIVALLAAASLDPIKHYYPINIPLGTEAKFDNQLQTLDAQLRADPMHRAGVRDTHALPVAERDLSELEQMVGGESLRGRTGGAVTLAVGMAVVLTDALQNLGLAVEGFVKYWYHFAIMFEALFILTTIDTGTRISRFLLQEALGKVFPKFEETDWLPGAVLTTLLVTLGWGGLVYTGSVGTIWPMFGIANQLLAVMALGLVTTLLVNTGRAKYAWVTIGPMIFVTSTTMTAGYQLIHGQFLPLIREGDAFTGSMNLALTLFVVVSVSTLLVMAASRWLAVLAAGAKATP
jgi:carbon starvation protein